MNILAHHAVCVDSKKRNSISKFFIALTYMYIYIYIYIYVSVCIYMCIYIYGEKNIGLLFVPRVDYDK